MKEEEKIAVFKEELALIEDSALKEATENLVYKLPDYFFTIPASASGKYHPAYALGEGGLVRHNKGAIKIALELLKMEQYEDLLAYKDEIIIALLLHDGWKRGKDDEGYMLQDHPKIAAEIVRTYNYHSNIKGLDKVASLIERTYNYHNNVKGLDKVATLIESHMGQWNADGVLPKPITPSQQFVHLCDYLASRRFLEVNFDK